MNGTDLLAQFRKSRAEAAFGGLVRRYTNLVFSVARRRLNNASLAEEATQNVFIRLAKAVPTVRSDAELVAWLHRTTVNASIDLWRSESRRHAREEYAASMQPDTTDDAAWRELAPIVDEALDELSDTDRQVVLLRYYERSSMRDLGLALGISEDAAKMRVSRALEHLRAVCGRSGVVCGAGVLGAFLTERAVEAAPAALILTLAGLQIPAGAAAGATASLLAPALKALLAAGVAVVVVMAAVSWMISKNGGGRIQTADFAPVTSNPTSSATPQYAPAAGGAGANAATTEPDALNLLRGVARARNAIRSGQMEFDAAYYDPARGVKGTNFVKIKASFDGIRRRFEEFDREYSYVGEANEDTNLQAQADKMPYGHAVEAGLLKPFQSHRVKSYDGTRVLVYEEDEGQLFQTQVENPGEAGPYVFDPRCLGISPWGFVSDTIESCLAYDHADSVALVGEESVEGVSCWHVRVRRNSMDSDFWLEKAHPARVLKHTFNGSVVVGKYDDANPGDPIPVEVMESLPHGTSGGGTAVSVTRLSRHNTQYNVSLDPASWTLAGLGMKIGTPVADHQLMRRIGYWNGTGLSDLPPGKSEQPQPATDRASLMTLIETEPFLPQALDAAEWIISNTQDGPDVEEAANVILENHIDDPTLVPLCQALERLRPACSIKLLEALLEKNPSIDVRGNACLALATLRKAEAGYGANKKAAAQAEQLYKRLIGEFGRLKRNGTALADLAKPELYELRQLTIGKPAPETEGRDLDGQALKLSDYRGRVVVLVFWGECGGCRPEVPSLLKLLDKYNGKPLAIVGVYCDDDAAQGKSIAGELGMVWPSLQDGRSGPISRAWNNTCWPCIDVIDAEGIIRCRNLFRTEAPGAVEKLMNEGAATLAR
jgi:RNA polymerase sigma factor (sigma-70 family)